MIEGPLPRRGLPADQIRDLLGQSSELLALIRFGHQAFADRVDTYGGGFPGGGHGGGSRGGGVSRPTEAMVEKTDTAEQVMADYSRALVKVDRAVRALWEIHAQHSTPHHGSARMSDPGCWSCSRVEGSFSPTYSTPEVEITEKRGTRTNTHKRKIPLCEWCYGFWRPGGNDRLPTFEEVKAHLEGRMVHLSSAERKAKRERQSDKEAKRLLGELAKAQVAG